MQNILRCLTTKIDSILESVKIRVGSKEYPVAEFLCQRTHFCDEFALVRELQPNIMYFLADGVYFDCLKRYYR